MEHLTTAMMSIQQAGNQTEAGMRQAETSAKALDDLAQEMEQVVNRYQL